MYDFNCNVLEGHLPKTASNLVKDWIGLHRKELERNWSNAKSGQPLLPIDPLE